MDNLEINLENCYGIRSLQHVFNFSGRGAKAFSIYAPNGLMKTSFARVFYDLSRGGSPKEERFHRESNCSIKVDGTGISKDEIYVLRSEIDTNVDSNHVTDILINSDKKSRYDSLVAETNKTKNKVINSLHKISKLKKDDVEARMLEDFREANLIEALTAARSLSVEDDLSGIFYGDLFDAKALAVLDSDEFLKNALEFNVRYQELFDIPGSIYKRGVFNPVKAETSFSTLNKQGYFEGGHKVHLEGADTAIGCEELKDKLEQVNVSIECDESLNAIKEKLAKNAQTQALIDLFERSSSGRLEFLINELKSENRVQFKKKLWAYYILSVSDVGVLLEDYRLHFEEMRSIESEAELEVPAWSDAIRLFNDRFIDMPFTLSLYNHVDALLGKEVPKLKFTFKDGDDEVSVPREEIRALSQGERRALYLLNFIFDVEYRKRNRITTLFVIDDVADSFDYKNKHAILKYLEDLTRVDNFYQIILTHNFDFFRSLANGFVKLGKCLMANRDADAIELIQAQGVKDYFGNVLKNNVVNDDAAMCASIPFSRNLIEYINGQGDADYLKLTSLLHWKCDTSNITKGCYFDIFNRLFGTAHPVDSLDSLVGTLFSSADRIANAIVHNALNLTDKVVLSIAIRLKAEIFLLDKVRQIKGSEDYWCDSNNQFGKLMREFSECMPNDPALKVLENVSVTVSSNIHLNSFMYEPILDLTIEHLIKLYRSVCQLHVVNVVVGEPELV